MIIPFSLFEILNVPITEESSLLIELNAISFAEMIDETTRLDSKLKSLPAATILADPTICPISTPLKSK